MFGQELDKNISSVSKKWFFTYLIIPTSFLYSSGLSKDAKIPIHVNSDNRFELQDLWNGKVVGQVVIGESVWNSHLATHENQAFKLTPIL